MLFVGTIFADSYRLPGKEFAGKILSMAVFAIIIGILLITVVLWDAFETVVLPRRVTRRIRLARLFYRYTWKFWSSLCHSMFSGRHLENYLAFYGPLSLLFLLVLWASILVVGFGFLYWSIGDAIRAVQGDISFTTCVYFSGASFFTLGSSDVIPRTLFARALTVTEAGLGFGFLAVVISYLPALNQSFSRRERIISLLDARAGSPPTAAEILRRNMTDSGEPLRQLLYEWERWAAELLESHLSYPVLAYFRSQHDNQSWLAALTAILDVSAFSMASMEGGCQRQARLTFAIARHTLVDVALVLRCPPHEPEHDRLPANELAHVRSMLVSQGQQLNEGTEVDQKLSRLRKMYEPFICALSDRLRLDIPDWVLESGRADNWQTSAWGRNSDISGNNITDAHEEDHF
jgi:hypothetical protein